MIYKHELPPIEFKPAETKHKSQWEIHLDKQVEAPAIAVKYENLGKLRGKPKPINWV